MQALLEFKRLHKAWNPPRSKWLLMMWIEYFWGQMQQAKGICDKSCWYTTACSVYCKVSLFLVSIQYRQLTDLSRLQGWLMLAIIRYKLVPWHICMKYSWLLQGEMVTRQHNAHYEQTPFQNVWQIPFDACSSMHSNGTISVCLEVIPCCPVHSWTISCRIWFLSKAFRANTCSSTTCLTRPFFIRTQAQNISATMMISAGRGFFEEDLLSSGWISAHSLECPLYSHVKVDVQIHPFKVLKLASRVAHISLCSC